MKLSYTPEKAWAEMQGELPLTLPFLALRVPILAVTLSSLALSSVMLVMAWRGGPDAYLWVAGLGFTFHVVDCLDGNMARTTGQSS
ncbi:MAG: CDP-alcohol phosphatidyltransferase family protein, partial [Deltaproteobacteria bacterium]|nr:CDP-alcohol phosphatidyltransferase family protein [Deltaproteobacteria bacterium]